MFGFKKNKGSPEGRADERQAADTGQEPEAGAGTREPEEPREDPRADMSRPEGFGQAAGGPAWDMPEWDDPPAAPEPPVERAGPAGQPPDRDTGQDVPVDPEPEPDPDAGPEDGMESALADMAGAGNRPRPKKKPKKISRKVRKESEGEGSGPGRTGSRWAAMSENRRQAVFTAGCAAAGFCAVLLVICGTVFACRMFRAKPNEILARPSSGDIYYDQAGRMHVNVHITREPDTEITVYMLPDGTVTTEKPEGSEASGNFRTMVLYVDSEGNISDKPPQKPDPAETEPQPDPDTVTLYLTEAGELAEAKPETGAYRPVTVKLDGNGGVAGVTKGEIEGMPSQPGQAAVQNPLAPIALYVGIDGKLTTKDPGDGAGKFVVDFGDGTGDPTVTPDTGDNAGPGQEQVPPEDQDGNQGDQAGDTKNPYDGMTEAEILAEAERRRQAGNGWYLEGDEVYIVKRGDTLSYLSGKFGFSVDFLAQYNQIRDKNLIITGEALRYPSASINN